MKMKYLPLLAFSVFTVTASVSSAGIFETIFGKAGRKFENNFRDCNWSYDNPVEKAMTDYERLTTDFPVNAKFQVEPFQESDFESKPWLGQFEYVIVVNNSNSIVQNEKMPPEVPMNLPSLRNLGLELPADSGSQMAAASFQSQYGSIAKQVYDFGRILYGPDKKTPIPSNIPGAQTIRVYRRGQLIRIAKVSTGRNQFEIRAQNPACKTRPAESYYSITEPGYFTFEELIKSGFKSTSYDDAAMPNAMFYMRNRGIALHEEPLDSLIPLLGRRASGGCTRLDPDTADNLFDAVYSTRGAQIPVINRNGTPVIDANGQLTYKTREVVTYRDGKKSSGPTYSALLIVQPDTVQGSDYDARVSFKFNRATFNSRGPAPF